MSLESGYHNRRSIRLKGFDYSAYGAYFVTICTHERKSLFGDIVNGEMKLNDAGEMVQRWWNELSNKFQSFQSDAYVVMPNHFHGIVIIDNEHINDEVSAVGADLRVCPRSISKGEHIGSPLRTPLPRIVQWFKTMTTNDYIRGVKSGHYPSFNKRLWQRNNHEHIIRNEQGWEMIRAYIETNAQTWRQDCFYTNGG